MATGLPNGGWSRCRLLAEAGIDPGRLLFHSLAANAPRDLINAVDQLLANLSRKTATDAAYPFWLTTGRSFTPHLTGARICRGFHSQEKPEVCIEINSLDARDLGIQSGEPITFSSRQGTITATARMSDRVRPGAAFLPRHFLEDVVTGSWTVPRQGDAGIPWVCRQFSQVAGAT